MKKNDIKSEKLNTISMIIDINFDDFANYISDDKKFKNLFNTSNKILKYLFNIKPLKQTIINQNEISIDIQVHEGHGGWIEYIILFSKSFDNKIIIKPSRPLFNLKLYSYIYYPMLMVIKKRIIKNLNQTK